MAIISKTYGRILAVLLAWLGIMCDQCGMEKYGTPSATYKAKGVVVSETDDAPIEGIRAVFKSQPNATWGADTVYTDNKGVFKLTSFGDISNLLSVELADVDGEKNGLFTDRNVEVDFSHVRFKGSNWEPKEVEKDLGIIKMKPKE
jgi:putative lipoprotein (rSAM/lipoprotein system)